MARKAESMSTLPDLRSQCSTGGDAAWRKRMPCERERGGGGGREGEGGREGGKEGRREGERDGRRGEG